MRWMKVMSEKVSPDNLIPGRILSMRTLVRFALPAVLLLFAVFLSQKCSHLKPFIGTGQTGQPSAVKETDLDFRMLLVGDAGAPRKDEPLLRLMTEWASLSPAKTLVAFLGDNIYPSGMPAPDGPKRREAEERITASINVILESGSQGIFLPGNHDWKQGLAGLKRQESFIRSKIIQKDIFLPEPGCLGPAVIDRNNLRIVVMDTTLWLSDRPLAENCPHMSLDESLASLDKAMESAGDRRIVFLSHHPLDSHGVHGGFYDWQDHIFPLTRWKGWLWIPLPFIGSLYPLIRGHIAPGPEELANHAYKKMIRRLKESFSLHPPLIQAAGHDHSLQILNGGRDAGVFLVAGAGSSDRLTPVKHGKNTRFAHQHLGFMSVDFCKDGRVFLFVVEPGNSNPVYGEELKKFD